MSLGRQKDRQSDLLLTWRELPRSAGHPFYDQLQGVLQTAGFDRFVEDLCKPYYSSSARGRSSLPPGRYFRMLLVGYFEGLDSERGIEWRCADSLSLSDFLLLSTRETVPDHSWLSKIRSRLSLEVHEAVFAWVLEQLAEHGLVKGDRIGVDASTMEANAVLRAIMRRDSGEGYREMLQRLAKESGIDTPTVDDLVRLDRQRPGKKLSNEDWESSIDSDARIAKMKEGRTRLAYKPEHAVDLDTGAIVAAPIHSAGQGDTKTLPGTLKAVKANLEAVGQAPNQDDPAELLADKGYHSRNGLKDLEDSAWKSKISEPKPKGILRWKGDDDAKRAYYNNRVRLLSGVARQAFKLRAELVERSFALALDRGGMRRAWLRGRDNLQKRYLVHISGYNLGLVMRLLTGFGTPRRWADANIGVIWLRYPINHQTAALFACLIIIDGQNRAAVLGIEIALLST